jgi:hypothetical protein
VEGGFTRIELNFLRTKGSNQKMIIQELTLFFLFALHASRITIFGLPIIKKKDLTTGLV